MFGRSGAAVEFLADWQIGDALLRIIAEARQRLTLASPYNRHWGHLKREVAAAQQRGVAVTIYYRADEPGPGDDYEGVTATAVRMLHAKIYANERVALVSTMNLVESSAMYSRDVGMLVRDAKLRKEIDGYLELLAADADAASAPAAVSAAGIGARPGVGGGPRRQVQTPADIVKVINGSGAGAGFCIECGTAKDFDPVKPMCLVCYNHHGRNGTHKVCHRCGEGHPAQVNEPLCRSCREARLAAGV